MLMDLMNNTFAGQITAGEHKAIIKSWTMVENPNNPENSYIRMEMVIDDKRNFVRNMFERDMSIFLSHSRQQLNCETEDINPREYLGDLIKNKTPLKIWFSYPVVMGRNGQPKRVNNINWMPPLKNPATFDDTASIDAELPPM